MNNLKAIPILCLLIILNLNKPTYGESINYNEDAFEGSNKVSSLSNSSIETMSVNVDPDVVEVFNFNNSKILITQNDINLMAQIVFAESKGEPYDGKVAVASVILNRVLSHGFPNTIREVIFQPNAFSCIVDGHISVTPTEECYSAVYDAIKGNDPTNEALFFYNPEIATCTWMVNDPKSDSRAIGKHLFFKIRY